MDAIHYRVRKEGSVVNKAVYIAIGIDMSGCKDVLGLYIGETETSKFWLSVMNELKNRGVEDILICSVDGLNGFSQAITAVYPQTIVQRCIVHQIRNSTRYVSYKDIKEFMRGSVDGLNGFSQAITAVYPQTIVQRCIVHQIRNSTRYVSYKDIKEFMRG